MYFEQRLDPELRTALCTGYFDHPFSNKPTFASEKRANHRIHVTTTSHPSCLFTDRLAVLPLGPAPPGCARKQ